MDQKRVRAIEILAEPPSHLLSSPVELGPFGSSGLGTNLVRPSIKMAASSKRSLYNPAPSQTPPPQIRYFRIVWKIISYSLSYFKSSMSQIVRKSLAQGVLVSESVMHFASSATVTWVFGAGYICSNILRSLVCMYFVRRMNLRRRRVTYFGMIMVRRFPDMN